jgi:anti-anti-sigma factor
MSQPEFLNLEQTQPYGMLSVCESISSLADTRVLAEMDDVVRRLRADQAADVIVDLRQAEYFGSTLLEALRMLWNEVRMRNGHLVLCNISSVGREVLEVSHFDRIWHLTANRAEALERLDELGPADA